MNNIEELEKTYGKKVLGSAEEVTDMHYIYVQLSHGRRAVFSAHTPIYVEVEEEQ